MNKETLRMQKLAGIITESQYKEKINEGLVTNIAAINKQLEDEAKAEANRPPSWWEKILSPITKPIGDFVSSIIYSYLDKKSEKAPITPTQPDPSLTQLQVTPYNEDPSEQYKYKAILFDKNAKKPKYQVLFKFMQPTYADMAVIIDSSLDYSERKNLIPYLVDRNNKIVNFPNESKEEIKQKLSSIGYYEPSGLTQQPG